MRRLVPCAPVLLGGLFLALCPAPARAQMDSREGIALQNQILELRRELQDLERGGGGQQAPQRSAPQPSQGAPVSGELTAQLLDRVSQLEDRTRALRGRVDQLQNQLTQQQQDFAKQLGDLSFRQSQSAAAPAAPTYAAPSASAAPSAGVLGVAPPAPAVSHRTPELSIQEANAALARRDYPAAESAAREVLSHAGSPRAVDAQYILAQSEAGEHNNQQAAVDYYDAYNRAPKAARASEALLGVANSLIALGDKRSACQALDKLRSEFPSPRADVREGVAAARRNGSCHG
ncbi:MAG: tetratricopeptide repeat protein [Janthinobacterium lividum]